MKNRTRERERKLTIPGAHSARGAVGITPACPTPGIGWIRFCARYRCVPFDAVAAATLSGQDGILPGCDFRARTHATGPRLLWCLGERKSADVFSGPAGSAGLRQIG